MRRLGAGRGLPRACSVGSRALFVACTDECPYRYSLAIGTAEAALIQRDAGEIGVAGLERVNEIEAGIGGGIVRGEDYASSTPWTWTSAEVHRLTSP